MLATTTATVRLPQRTNKRLAAAARQRGLSLSRYFVESAQQAAASPLPTDPSISLVALEIEAIVRPENSIPSDS